MKYAMFAVILAVSLIAGAAARPLGDHAEKGKLRVGILKERPPLAFEENGKLSGLGVELTRDIGRQMKRDVVLIQGRSVELYALLEQGEIDVAVCLPRLAGAYSNLRFIPTGLSVNRRILVTESGMDIRSEQDFQGRHLVFIETDRQYADLARKAGAEVFFVRDIPSALAALEKHEADAYVAGMGEVAAQSGLERRAEYCFKGRQSGAHRTVPCNGRKESCSFLPPCRNTDGTGAERNTDGASGNMAWASPMGKRFLGKVW